VGGGTNPGITVANATPASGGDGNITYQWRRSGTSSATLTGTAETYSIGNDASNYADVGTYTFTRYARDATCNASWSLSDGQYTLTVAGVNQPQGGCTFTQPAVLETFASFPEDYSGSTYVTLTDSRDNKNYAVVKIGGRWVMAQNLNYQKDLTHQTSSASPTTTIGRDLNLIGHFWCPGADGATTSSIASCDVWGALYSWETAMSFNGKGNWAATDDITTYCTGAANTDNCKLNWGRTATGSGSGGRGICPENWHVPTDFEWGVILDGMESGGGTEHQNASDTNQYGTNAGSRAKSSCTCGSSTCVDDAKANWYYHATNSGTDNYGFRVLPAGGRANTGSYFNGRGSSAYFWSSSASSSADAWSRDFYYSMAPVGRYNLNRSYGFSVRCVRDE
jgi:uncharacterized protein (TIGR02145 family)